MHIIQYLFGGIALVTSFIGLLPQAYKTYKTQSSSDISMLMLMNYLLCSVSWIIYGLCISAAFVTASNVVGLLSCVLLITLKVRYDKDRKLKKARHSLASGMHDSERGHSTCKDAWLFNKKKSHAHIDDASLYEPMWTSNSGDDMKDKPSAKHTIPGPS